MMNAPLKRGVFSGGTMFRFRDGFYADVRIEDRFTTNISYKNGVAEQCGDLREKKAFIRVFDGRMWYYASTDNVDSVQQELDNLYGYASPCADIENNPVVRKFQVNRDTAMRFENDCVANVPLSEKRAYLENTAAKFRSEYCSLVIAVYLDRYSVYEFYSSKGAEIRYDFQTSGAVFSMSFAKDKENFSDSIQKSGTRFDDLKVEDKEIDDFVKESENVLVNAKKLENPGVYPVVLAPIVTGVFAHESFGHKSEADFMLGDETLAKEWAIGKKVSSELLSIVDSGTYPGSGYVPYDDEGTKCTCTYLIKEGVLAGRLHSALTAASLDEELTGNARAINCGYEPIVRMTTTVIKGGESTVDELIGGVKHGYYIKNCKHGSGMSTFTIAPNAAYEIKDGMIGDPVKISVITGNVFETLGDIDGVANDETVLTFVTGGCGKMEQFPLNVGLGGPHIRVRKMNVQ